MDQWKNQQIWVLGEKKDVFRTMEFWLILCSCWLWLMRTAMWWPKHDTHTQSRTLTSLLMLLSSHTSRSEQESSYSACLSASVHMFSLSNGAECFFYLRTTEMFTHWYFSYVSQISHSVLMGMHLVCVLVEKLARTNNSHLNLIIHTLYYFQIF